LIIEGESREEVIIISSYASHVETGLFRAIGSSSLSLKKMKLIHSYSNGLERNILDFTSSGNLTLSELTIEQDESIFMILFY
jgi:hypothetical protein